MALGVFRLLGWWPVKTSFGDAGWFGYLWIFWCAFVLLSAVLLMFGGVMRPLHKWLWHSSLEEAPHYVSAIAQSVIQRNWLWIDEAGKDRDA
jgi:hypothetical protein